VIFICVLLLHLQYLPVLHMVILKRAHGCKSAIGWWFSGPRVRWL